MVNASNLPNMRLTLSEARYVLDLIREKEGPGYSPKPGVGKLQAKLSLLVELGQRLGDPSRELDKRP